MFKVKGFAAFFLAVFLLNACSFSAEKKPREDSSDFSERPEVKEEEAKPIAEVKDYQVETDSVLTDDTGIGFNYEGEMVSDLDFSTAWCSSVKNSGGEISYVFNSPVKTTFFGIVPGFARDEDIYLKNNRLKKLALSFDGEEFKSFDLEDKYGMQFVDFGEEKEFKKISIEVDEIYDGSKYEDTCISEWDFVSDYVKNKDSAAAKAYYENYKKKDALKPYDIIGAITVSDVTTTGCKNPEEPSSLVIEEDGTVKYPGWKILYVAAHINEYGSVADTLDMELYYKGLDGEWYIADSALSLPVEKACNGKLYSYVEVYTGFYDHEYLVKFYNKGKFIGSKEISIYW